MGGFAGPRMGGFAGPRMGGFAGPGFMHRPAFVNRPGFIHRPGFAHNRFVHNRFVHNRFIDRRFARRFHRIHPGIFAFGPSYVASSYYDDGPLCVRRIRRFDPWSGVIIVRRVVRPCWWY
jgi:hypothetical protein